MIPSHISVLETREALAISLATLKAKSEDHCQARERIQNALAVGDCAANSMKKSIEDNSESLGKLERYSASALRDSRDTFIAEFDVLDADIVGPYNVALALPAPGGDLEFVRGI